MTRVSLVAVRNFAPLTKTRATIGPILSKFKTLVWGNPRHCEGRSPAAIQKQQSVTMMWIASKLALASLHLLSPEFACEFGRPRPPRDDESGVHQPSSSGASVKLKVEPSPGAD
jgi:hypothetical protein